MANGGMPMVDFSILGNLGNTYKAASRDATRERTLAELGQGGNIDYGAASSRLLAAGDVEGGMSLARLADMQAQRGLQERGVRLQEEAARDKPQIVWQEDENGQKVPYKIEPFGRGISRVEIQGQPGGGTPNNPFALGGRTTDEQNKAALYANRMFAAERILSDPKITAAATSSVERIGGAIGERVPFGLGRGLVSTEYQKFDQAQRDFINATLRRESGAVINPDEFANARQQYFPQPGDSPEVLRQKAANRREAIAGIAGGAGRTYVPPALFDPEGRVVDNPAAARRAQAQQGQPAQPPGAPPQRPASGPTPQHVQALRANPQRAAEFDAKFGPGAAARLLGQQ